MIYITGDKHRDFSLIKKFCAQYRTTKDDIMIVLGDAGINVLGDKRDDQYKSYLAQFPITFFCIHGNHEKRPTSVPGYQEIPWHGGTVYQQPE